MQSYADYMHIGCTVYAEVMQKYAKYIKTNEIKVKYIHARVPRAVDVLGSSR